MEVRLRSLRARSGTMSATGPPRPVRWTEGGGAIELLDQSLLPGEETYVRLERAAGAAEAIRSLRVRGAPAIGITAAMGLAVEMTGGEGEDEEALRARFRAGRELLASTRPTGNNLGWALERMSRRFEDAVPAGADAVARALREEADAIAREDEAMCRRIGEAGLELIPDEGAGVYTHCNTGALATGGLGTALAPLYLATRRGIPLRVYAGETRPVLQGARLTAWELARGGVDVTVVVDSTAAALMKAGEVSLVIVGADRIAANGDVANKIGTYGLAVLARHHGIPFFAAAPRSTFDVSLETGAEIPIEERDPDEVRAPGGALVTPPGAPVFNPAFDVTPAHLVTALVTDAGILRPPYPVAIREAMDAGEEQR